MKKAKILIVEDEAIIAMEIEDQLQSLGYEVTSIVDTGEKAIQKAEADKPDLMLMDIRIKGEIDGIDTAEIIRERFGIPVIFSTAYLDEERIEHAKITMPFGYVLKPIQERDLRVTIEMALHVSKVDGERRKIEQALKNSEERFQLAMEATFDGLFDWNIKTNEIYFSPGYFTMLGYGANEIPYTFETYQSLLHPEDAIHTDENMEKFLKGKTESNHIEIRLKTKSGDWLWVLSRGSIVEHDKNGNPTRMVGTNVNIDERKRAEEQLKFEKSRSQQYLNVAGVLLIALDTNGDVTLINPKGCEILGYKNDEIVGGNWFDSFLPSEGINEVRKVFNQIMEGNVEPVEYYENPIFRKDGSQRYIAWHNSILRDDQNRIIGLFSSGEDITEQKQIELEIANLKNFYQDILESVEEGIWVTNSEDIMIYFNRGMEKIAGVSSKDALGLSVTNDFPEETTQYFIQFYFKAKTTLLPQQYKARVVTPIGRETIQAGHLIPRIKNGTFDGMICSIQDITERNQTEKKF